MHPHRSYPIDAVLARLKKAFRTERSLVLHAPPGAGKTTRVPLELLKELAPEAGKIVMLEPRRIAAVAAARWMAHLLQEEPGGTVGYTIRFDARTSAATRIEVVTEGVLTRRIQADPSLTGTAAVIFDEFHERSIHADLALALCLDVRKGLREDLKLLVMSATLATGPVAELLGGATVISSEGRTFPVEERYLADRGGRLAERTAAAVRTALRETEGDILAFLPGAGEIRSCAAELRGDPGNEHGPISLHPLYGDLPFEEQERAILPLPDRRKVVLATNIAETSLTIEGVRVVVDSGSTRVLRHDPSTGMNRLMTVPVSQASAEQRKGRAGRLGPGVCYRLFSEQTFRGLPAYSQPEILMADLSPLVLELAVWGVHDPSQLSWLDRPPSASWGAAVELLGDIGALDDRGSVTAVGREMARFPLHPRLARLLLRSVELGAPRLGADLAALLTERDIFRHHAQDPASDDPDVQERLDTLRRWRLEKASRRGDLAALWNVNRTARQLMGILGLRPGADGGPIDPELVSRLLLSAFPDRLCKRRDEGGRVFIHAQGRGVRLRESSALVNHRYLIAVTADAGEKAEGFIHLAAPVTEELVRSECGRAIASTRRVQWDQREGRIIAAVEERYGALLLSTKPFPPSDEEAAPILCEAVRSVPGLLSFPNEARQFQARVGLLRRAFPEQSWPDLSPERLLAAPEEWLLPWLAGVRSGQGLKGIDLLSALRAQVPRQLTGRLDELAPPAITAPSGSRIVLDYTAGDAPVLAVKLQEMFGLADTPVVASGRVKVLLHLLSPARRPVQITHDLKGFWNSVYPEVKKDLKGRYPKHPWPDDPWNAAPTARTNRRRT